MHGFMLAVIGAVGLVFGSFVTALSYRLPRGQSIVQGRSRCPACNRCLSALDLVPVVSWLLQRGGCRHCGARISARYPVIELVTMTLFVGSAAIVTDIWHLVILLAMIPAMVALAVIDLEHRRLPNVLIALLALLAVAWRWRGDQGLVTGSAVAVAVFAVAIALNAAARRLSGREGLGMGDAKLFAVAALALPLPAFLMFAFLAGGLGVAWGVAWRWRTGAAQFPFAPAVLLSFWLALVAGDEVIGRLQTIAA